MVINQSDINTYSNSTLTVSVNKLSVQLRDEDLDENPAIAMANLFS